MQTKVTLRTATGLESPGTLTVLEFDKAARTRRALKILGFCWGLAIITIPIPPVHWVSVPGFLIAGPILAWLKLGEERIVAGGESTCPKCQAPFRIEPGKPKFPMTDTCSACHEEVTILERA